MTLAHVWVITKYAVMTQVGPELSLTFAFLLLALVLFALAFRWPRIGLLSFLSFIVGFYFLHELQPEKPHVKTAVHSVHHGVIKK